MMLSMPGSIAHPASSVIYTSPLFQVLLSIPGTNKRAVDDLDRLVADTPISAPLKNNKIDKRKKDLLRRILTPVSCLYLN